MNSLELTTTTAAKTLTIKRPNNVTKFKRKPADAKKKKAPQIMPDLPAEVLEYMSHFFDAPTLAKFSICSKYCESLLSFRTKQFLKAYKNVLEVEYNFYRRPFKKVLCHCGKRIKSHYYNDHVVRCSKRNPAIGRFVNVDWPGINFIDFSTYEIIDTNGTDTYIKYRLPEWSQPNYCDEMPDEIKIGFSWAEIEEMPDPEE